MISATFAMCKKADKLSPREDNKLIASNEVAPTNKIPGQCPYPCPDARCANYEIGCPVLPVQIADAYTMGPIHNSALDRIEATVNFNDTNKTTVSNAIVSAITYVATANGITMEPQAIQRTKQEYPLLRANNNYLLGAVQIDSMYLSYAALIRPTLTAKEQLLFDKALDIFVIDAHNMTGFQELDSLVKRARKVKAICDTTSWANDGKEGATTAALISITLSSAEYWRNKEAAPEMFASGESYVVSAAAFPNPLKWLRRATTAEADAAGYLKGWFQSWFIDEEEKASVRIKHGLLEAADWSGIKKVFTPQ